MTGKIQLLTPEISDKSLDHRGAIFSYIPYHNLVEFVYIDTKQGTSRGHHYHKELDEYIVLTHGEGLYVELLADGNTKKIIIGAGQSIYIPAYTPHTFIPLTDCKSVSMLTKKWNECIEPITSIKK